jgi:hypothetical protein
MSAYHATTQHWFYADPDFPPSAAAADKAAALSVLRASIHLALESADADEVFDTIDAAFSEAG